MVDPDTYIKEGLKIVKTLISKGDLQAALSACKELLKVNPYDRGVQKYLEKIESDILEENIKKVDADINSTMHLWDEQRYEDLMKIYTRLYPYAPQYKRLRQLIEKLNEKLTEQQKAQKEELSHKSLGEIAGLLKDGRFGDAIQTCNALLGVDPLNKDATEYLAKAKRGLVEQRLKENERIIDSTDFERAAEFFDNLLAIDPENKEVKKLSLRAKEHMAEQRALAAKIHLNESIIRMKELFKNADYEKVIQSCDEISLLDPNNFTARLFRKKAQNTMMEESNTLIVNKLKEAWAALEPQYAKNPQGFTRV